MTSVSKFPSRFRIRVLLHHISSSHVWKALEECVKLGFVHEIGVSNHNIEALTTLLEYATIKPIVNQLEVHPFLDPNELQPLLQFCKINDIPVQAHSVLVRGLYWSTEELINAAREANLTQAQYLVSWAASQKGVTNVCISTSNNAHLQELLSSPIFSDSMPSLKSVKRYRLYPFVTTHFVKMSWNMSDLSKVIIEDMRLIKENLPENLSKISNLSLMIPSVTSKYSNIGRDIARETYPELDDERRFSKFHSLTKPLRLYCHERNEAYENQERKKTLSTCCVTKRIKQYDDQISETVLNPTPMPVDVSEKETLEPFFHYLSSNDTFVGDKEFFKGAVIDKRLDMCKQVTGPEHIQELCEAVSKNTQIRHFLLGNNIAFKDAQHKATSMANVMRSNQEIETWYLAGNYIGCEATEILCQGLLHNTQCKSLWLKRNPIGITGAKSLCTLLHTNKTLELLDLDNCGILDQGVVQLFSGCDQASFSNSLKHLYMDANGITEMGAVAIAEWCKNHKNTIKSLYVSINRLGDNGVKLICDSLYNSTSLKRISFDSNRLTDNVGDYIVDFALSCPKLICLGLGCYKSTFDMGEKPNFFTNVEPFIRLIQTHPSLAYLDLLMNNIPDNDIIRLISVAKECNNYKHLTIDACQILTPSDNKKNLYFNGHGDRKALKFIRHPEKVLHIDSIYRNRM